MGDMLTIPDPISAQAFLKGLGPVERRKGEFLFRNSQVGEVLVETPECFSVQVIDGKPHHVTLEYDFEGGWMGECSCHKEFNCEHAVAAMMSLLAEYRASVVRSLSSNTPLAPAAMAAYRKRESKESKGDLALLLTEKTGRNLRKEELHFIANVRNTYERCKKSQRITGWEFSEMGFRMNGYRWDALRIWPSFPENEHEFWLYVAHAAREQKLPIPDFMLPITDLASVRERINRWHRAQEIQDWKHKLDHCNFDSRFSISGSKREYDLRLVITSEEIRLQRCEIGKNHFEYLARNTIRAIAGDYDEGLFHFTAEGDLIWQFFSQVVQHGNRVRLSYLDARTLRLFGRILRTRHLDSRIVNSQGHPLDRPNEPLRWKLDSPENGSDNYFVRLVNADGQPAPAFLCIVPGSPSLYVTEQAIYNGPPQMENVLDPCTDNKIPAPAIEGPAGVEFLGKIGVELPAPIRNRLHLLPFQVAIDCKLKLPYPDAEMEECVLSVVAEAPDGHQQSWDGYNWNHKTQKRRGNGAYPKDSITVYERTNLELIPSLLAPLQPRNSNDGSQLSVRVTKKFPEQFAMWLKTVPPQITVRLAGDLASLAGPDVSGRVSLDATEAGIDWFDLRVVLDVSDTTLSAAEIKALLNAKGGYVRLEGKGWRRLQYDLSEEENERLARLGLSARELTAEPQRLHALQLADEAAKKFLPAQQIEQIQRRAGEIKTRVAPELPSGITAQLRPYQVHGFHFLAYLSTNRFGGILADDMGLGKTLQTLAWVLWLRAENGHKQGSEESAKVSVKKLPSLVVCPKSVMDNWDAEAKRFTSGLSVKIWPASELNQFCDKLDSADLHIINYNQLRLLGEKLKPTRWLAVILDEGQYIKNPNSQTAQIARSLSAEHRLILSGTPIENRLLDLWSLMSFAMPGVLGSRAQFARTHDSKGDPFARGRLAARVRPFVLRRTKNQVATDLPDKIEEDLFSEIEGEQQTLYRAELKRAQQLLLGIKTQKELASQQFHFLTSLLRLRQICCDPRLVKEDSKSIGAKAEALLDVLEPIMEEGQKVLVFSQFVEMLRLLQPALRERNWPLFCLTGETENRGELVQDFQNAKGSAVFLISLKAGGFGLNLTAASYVVLFDPWWNPAVENQAIDRTHRIGQTNKVIAYRLLIKNSIEEKIRELQKQKKALAQDVLGEEKFSQSLTLEDLHFLFAD